MLTITNNLRIYFPHAANRHEMSGVTIESAKRRKRYSRAQPGRLESAITKKQLISDSIP